MKGKRFRIIYVCQANRFRSPAAEFIHSQVSNIPTLSAGTDADDGLQMSREMAEALKDFYPSNAVLEFFRKFRSRNIHGLELTDSDILVAMDKQVYEELRKTLWNNRIEMLCEMGIPDPTRMPGTAGYRNVAEIIKKQVEKKLRAFFD